MPHTNNKFVTCLLVAFLVHVEGVTLQNSSCSPNENRALIKFEAVRTKNDVVGRRDQTPQTVTYDSLAFCLGEFSTCVKSMDLERGEFTPPAAGIYQFYFQTLTGDDCRGGQALHRMAAVKNGVEVDVAHNQFRNCDDNGHIHFQFILDLEVGDAVSIHVTHGKLFIAKTNRVWGITKFGGELIQLR